MSSVRSVGAPVGVRCHPPATVEVISGLIPGKRPLPDNEVACSLRLGTLVDAVPGEYGPGPGLRTARAFVLTMQAPGEARFRKAEVEQCERFGSQSCRGIGGDADAAWLGSYGVSGDELDADVPLSGKRP